MVRFGNAVNLIIVRDGKVLLVKRQDNLKEFPGCWSIPGGGLEINETHDDALVREIDEELGCSLKDVTYFKSIYLAINETFHVRSLYFYGDISGEIKLQNQELAEYNWFDLNEDLFTLDWAFNQGDVMKQFLDGS